MSKHNRERRKRPRWECLRCHAPMHRELQGEAEKRNAAAAKKHGVAPAEVIHVCGACEAFHFAIEAGTVLRLLTPAEEFQLRCEVPKGTDELPRLAAEVNDPAFPGLGIMHVATN